MDRAVAPGSFLRVHVQAMQDLHEYDYRIGHIRAWANCLIRMRQLYAQYFGLSGNIVFKLPILSTTRI